VHFVGLFLSSDEEVSTKQAVSVFIGIKVLGIM